MAKIHSYFDRPVHKGVSFAGLKSRTKQSFAVEADINNIIAKYNRTGVMVDPGAVNRARVPLSGDFSTLGGFDDVQNRLVDVINLFDSLPSGLRKELDNDPGKLLPFIDDPDNRDRCVQLGLIDGSLSAPDQPVPSDPPADPDPAPPA